jgi:peptidoglycan LD-endopeptidase LytH
MVAQVFRRGLLLALLPVVPACLFTISASAQPFGLPTANRAIYEPGGEDRYFVGTVGKGWMTGTFGCVRSDGWQMHEGLDVRCLQRDKRGEPTDPVLATADGTVAYISTHPGLSNYGNYIVLRHQIEGLDIYSLYAHLRAVREGLQIGQTVKAGDPIATMGRTANTHEGISKDRAHVHFELNLLANERFSAWFKKACPGERNDHGNFNGQNLVGIDPRLILLQEHQQGSPFSLLGFLQHQTELCRVVVRKTDFSWLRRYPALVRPNPVAQKEGVAGYEIALNFNALAYEVTPRAASEIKGQAKYQLLSVNEAEYHKNPARKLVAKRGSRWTLTDHAVRELDMLTF